MESVALGGLAAGALGCALTACSLGGLDDLQRAAASSGASASASSASSGAGGAATSSSSASSSSGAMHDPPWWDTAYPRRWPLTIHAAADAGAGVQAAVSVDVGALVGAASVDSLRVVRWDGAAWTELPRAIDELGALDVVWFPLAVAVPVGPDDTSTWLYAGAPAPAPPAPPGEVFPDLHVSFDDSTWTQSFAQLGAPSLASGELELGALEEVRSLAAFDAGRGVDFTMRVVTGLPQNTNKWLGGGFQRENDFDDIEPWILWLSRDPGAIGPEASISAVMELEQAPQSPLDAAEHLYGVERYADHATYRLADQVVETLGPWPGGAYTAQVAIRLMNTDDVSDATVRYGMVRVRRCVDPPPAVTLGTVEIGP